MMQQRAYIQNVAIQLMQSVNYRSAGTVEFVMDTDTQEFYFLEVKYPSTSRTWCN